MNKCDKTKCAYRKTKSRGYRNLAKAAFNDKYVAAEKLEVEKNHMIIAPNAAICAQSISSDGDLTIIQHVHYGATHQPAPNSDHGIILRHLQGLLTKRYSHLKMAGLPWLQIKLSLKQFYIRLQLATSETENNLSTGDIKLSEIFGPELRGQRILIEGYPGFGKTSLALKLCYDWQLQKRKYIARFDLVVLLTLRDFTGDVTSAIFNALDPGQVYDRKILLDILYSSKYQLLLVMDGLDEVGSIQDKSLVQLIRSEIFSDATIVFTSRPGKLTSDWTSHQADLLAGISSRNVCLNLTEFLDRRVNILGISPKLHKEFTLKHLKNSDPETLERVISMLNEKVCPEFLKCPLFLLMLVIIFAKEHNITVETKTGLYKMIHNYVVRRFLSTDSSQSITTNAVDLFGSDRDNSLKHMNVFLYWSEVAFNTLAEGRHSFTVEDVKKQSTGAHSMEKEILKMGFLTKTVSEDNFGSPVETYETAHKSMIEFAAAYYLWHKLQESKDSFVSELNRLIIARPQHGSSTSTSLLFPFLAGLMNQDANVLFKCLMPFAAEYRYWFGSLAFTLSECSLNEDLLVSLIPLLPREWKIPWYSPDYGFSLSTCHKVILELALTKNITKIIVWHLNQKVLLPTNLNVEILSIIVEGQLNIPEESSHYSLTCKGLRVEMKKVENVAETWSTLLTLIQNINFDHISFYFEDMTISHKWAPFFHSALTSAASNKLAGCKIKWLVYKMQVEKDVVLPLLCELIRLEQIQGIILSLMPPVEPVSFSTDITELIDSSSKSVTLTNFILVNNEIKLNQSSIVQSATSGTTQLVLTNNVSKWYNNTVPLQFDIGRLMNGGRKKWDWVWLQSFNVDCKTKVKLLEKINMDVLQLVNSEFTESAFETLSLCRPNSFHTNVEVLKDLTKGTHFTWPTTKKLDILNLGQCTVGKHFYEVVSKFPNVNILSMTMVSPEPADSLLTAFHHFIDKIFPTTNIKAFEFWSIESNVLQCSVWIRCIVDWLSQCTVSPLERIKVSSQFSPNPTHLPKDVEKLVCQILDLLSLFKKPLIYGSLPMLVISNDGLFHYLPKHKPNGISSLVDLFPKREGFEIQNNISGDTKWDSTYDKRFNEIFPGRITEFHVTHS